MNRMTLKQYHSLKGKNKYGAMKCEADGIKFDSKAEREYYLLLKADKEVVHIDVHPIITLPGGIRYKPDFLVYQRLENLRWAQFHEVKGIVKPEFKRLRKLFDATHPLAPMVVVRKTKKGWEWI